MKPVVSRWLFAAAVLAAAPSFAEGVAAVSPGEGVSVPLLSEFKKAYFATPRDVRREKFADRTERLRMWGDSCKPLKVAFAWNGGEAPFDFRIVCADGREFVRTNLAVRTVSIGDFEIAASYRWSVTDRAGASFSRTFTTEAYAPRFLDGGTVPNVRDLGGRIGLGGRRIRQNLVFRSAGLNENAHRICTTEKEALSGPDGAVKKLVVADVREAIAALKPFESAPGRLPMPRMDLHHMWQVCRFLDNWGEVEALAALREFKSVDEPIKGVKPVAMKMDEKGFLSFPERGTGTAFLRQEIEVEEDCAIPICAAADWFWALAVNGKVVRNYLVDGNGAGDVVGPSHRILLRLKKGRNLIAVVIEAGSMGWCWVSRPDWDAVPAKALPHEIQRLGDVERGVLYRLKEFRPGETRINDANRDFWLKKLAIRTDIDLRSSEECYGMTGSPLGPTVKWAHISSSAYGGMANEGGRRSFTKVFRLFLDPENYPIDFHCIAGQDRTGAVAFILNALLGVEEDELAKDWEATGFWNPGLAFVHSSLYDKLVKVFDGYEGATLCERVERYVKSLGFTDDDLAKFRRIMLED